jgi:thioredoxin-disulfide reductase
MKNSIYDILIIGAGPAGMTAAIYAARREMKTIIVGKEVGGQMIWASEIENYPGYLAITSFELINKMQEQVNHLGVQIRINEVKTIEKAGDIFKIYTNQETIEAKTLLIAMGLIPRRLAIPGEVELSGKGVSYCANCDGPFFKNMSVAVVGGGNSALDAAEVLSKIARQVYLIHRREEFKGFEALANEVKKKKNVMLLLNCEVKNIAGQNKVESIQVANALNQEVKNIKVDGIFIEIGRVAHTDLVSSLAERNEYDQIIVDGKGRTATPGLFAAGDVTNIPYKQITIACGQGAIAALAAYEYLQLKEGKEVKPVFDRGKKQST